MEVGRAGSTQATAEDVKRTEVVDFEVVSVRGLAEGVTRSAGTDVEKVIALFFAVRDTIRYDPYVRTGVR